MNGPSEFLSANASLFSPGDGKKALDISSGSGHNAVYLDSLGFQVDIFVSRPEEAQVLARLAERTGAHLKIFVADPKRIHFQKEKYDLVLSSCDIDRNLALQINRTLKPGGIVILEKTNATKPKGLLLMFKDCKLLEREEPFRKSAGSGIILQKPFEDIAQ